MSSDGQVEARPLLGQVGVDRAPRAVLGGEVGGRSTWPSRTMPGNPTEARSAAGQRRGQPGQHRDQFLGGQRVGGGDPHPVGHHGPRGVEHRGLEAGAADVDGQGEGVLGLGLGLVGLHVPDGARVRFVGPGVGAHAYTLDTATARRPHRAPRLPAPTAAPRPVASASMSDQPWLDDACSLVDAFRAGTLSPTEALDASLAAIDASGLNAFSHLDVEAAGPRRPRPTWRCPSGGSRWASRSWSRSTGGPTPRRRWSSPTGSRIMTRPR